MIALGLGSNISTTTKEDNIAAAIELLNQYPGIRVDKISSLYETEPVGFKEQPSFLNAAISIVTELPPLEVLAACLGVEQSMGRIRQVRWGPRNIDVDLLVYHDVEMAAESLELPHPRLPDRNFVLIPLAEIAGDTLVYKGKTARQLLAVTSDNSQVMLYGSIQVGWQAKTVG